MTQYSTVVALCPPRRLAAFGCRIRVLWDTDVSALAHRTQLARALATILRLFEAVRPGSPHSPLALVLSAPQDLPAPPGHRGSWRRGAQDRLSRRRRPHHLSLYPAPTGKAEMA